MELENIKGIGKSKLEILKRLNINDVEQLQTYYPFRYNVIKRTDINNLQDEDKVIIDGVIETKPNIFYFSRKKDKTSFKLNTGTKLLNIVIFNRGFLKSKLNIGTIITVIGKYDKNNNNVVAQEIRLEKLEETPKIEPVYHITNGITGKQLNSIINKTLLNKINDYIPDYINEKYKLLNKKSAIIEIHNPTSVEKLKQARSKLKYEELFMFMLKINYLKNKNHKEGLKKIIDYTKVEELIKSLPFELTKDKLKSVEDIYKDMTNPIQMNRLLQGDVGSGKTIVSFISLYMNYLAGYQGSLMAPTEILSIQHYNNIKKILPNLKIELLTGKTKQKEKKQILEDLKNNKIDILIGTHSLISEDVIYNNLGLVITDEQHRFGVNQRANLKNKGTNPDILYMSATPIPRTYALTIYGDMEVSNIKTMPSGRIEVKTLLKTNDEIKEVLELMYKELKNNHQVYVIAPLIESEESEMENVYELEEKMNKAFGKLYKVGILHGKMNNKEKDDVMNDFKDNKIQILVSTTVIEVGIDVKNATVIAIFDSYRFGLSALHQLRGRVGRSNLESYCILISDKETERLNVLTKTTDGFKISEEDFKLRGSGDLFGIRQSGDMYFKIADLKNDFNILVKAKEDSKEFIEKNLNKEEYKYIKAALAQSINLD